MTAVSAGTTGQRHIPKSPTLGWGSFVGGRRSSLPSVGDLPHRCCTSSGRAALLAAIRQLELPAGSTVLVSTYHCPTMVAPILRAGMVAAYYPIGPDGQPQLDGINPRVAQQARAICVAHYFGLPNSLRAVRDWCDDRSIALVEDCAHSYFGQAGERPVGHWGDYATASLTKFFPLAEAGMLASAHHTLNPLGLSRPPLRDQAKGVLDVLEFAHLYGRLPGLNHLLSPLYTLKNRGRGSVRAATGIESLAQDEASMMAGCDMSRCEQSPTGAALALHRYLPQQQLVERRRKNFTALSSGLATAPGTSTLFKALPAGAAPYVFPLQVHGSDRADKVYADLRAVRMPVFRWDQIWPGTPSADGDVGPRWNREMLQLLCHQDLNDPDIQLIVATTMRILQSV